MSGKKPDITIITPTGDRPQTFALLERWMAEQDFDGLIQWIVVDDGLIATDATMGQLYIRRERHADDPEHTLGVNLLAALPHVEADKVLFVEDDDYYGPRYVRHYAALLDEHDIVGEERARYYGIKSRRYRRMGNAGRASLAQTGVRASVLPELERIIRVDLSDWFIDLKLWKLDAKRHTFCDADDKIGLHCGIKLAPGRQSPVRGNQMMQGTGDFDEGFEVLRKWTGAAADCYIRMAQPASAGEVVAIISQGPTGNPELGLVGDLSRFTASIAVNKRIHQYPNANWWAFSDQSVFTHKDKRWQDEVLGREKLPRIVTKSTTAHTLRNNKAPGIAEQFDRFAGTLEHETLGLPAFPTMGRQWNKQGGPGALALAWYLKPARVECYGCDMCGVSDIAGLTDASKYRDRFDYERRVWFFMASAMASMGIDVVHVQPDGSFRRAVDLFKIPGHGVERRFQYANAHGWVTQEFVANSEEDFRDRVLARNIGKRLAESVKVREVVR